MKKVFGIAAMLLALAACNKIETNVQPVENNEGIPFSATISVGNNATTKALAESGSTIVATWAVDETVALIHNGVKDEMTVSAVNEGVATITGTITNSPSDGDAVTVIYPASAADGTTGNIKADMLYEQKGLLTGAGSIAANYDTRKGTGTLKVSGTTASLNGNMTLDNQFAIFKFTTKNSNGSATIDVKPLTITIGAQNYVIDPASATSELFVALPAISSQAVTFTATGSDSKTYTCSKASVTFAAGKYYQSTLKMASAVPPAVGHALSASIVGEIVGSDGKAYAVVDKGNLPTGVTAVAMVAYKSGSNGLAIALTDETGTMNWTTAKSTCEGKTAVGGNSWHLPSQPEWNQMFVANGAAEDSFTGLNTAITTAGGTGITKWQNYWTSSLDGDYPIYIMIQSWVGYDNPDSEGGATGCLVRACLAF